MIPAIPIKMHSIIEKYFDYYRELGQLPPMIQGTIIKGQIARDMPKTLSYTDKNGMTLWGRPDTYIMQGDKSIVPLDHKTKSKSPDIKIHPGVQIQLSVYSYLLNKMGFKTTNRAYVVYYFPGENIQLHEGMKLECKVVKTVTNYGLVETLLDEANRVLHGPIPKSSKSCIYCNWRKEDN